MEDKISIMQQIVEGKTDYWDHHNSVKLNIVKGQLQNIIEDWMKWTLTSIRCINSAAASTAAIQLNLTSLSAAEAASVDSQLQTASIVIFSAFSALTVSDAAESAASLSDFSMSQNLITVMKVWQKWTADIVRQPSIQSLDDVWDPVWRKKHKEKMFYSQRKGLIDEIHQCTAESDSWRAVSDLKKIHLQSRWLLDALQKLLKLQQKKPSL